jgi:hypothetical protein
VTRVGSLTVEKMEITVGLDVMRWIQCSAGKSKNASSCSWSPVILATALGVLDRLPGLLADLRQRLAGRRLRRFGQAVEGVDHLVHPAVALSGLGEYLGQRGGEPQRPVADRQHRGLHAPPPGVPQQPGPRLGRLAVPVGEGDQILLPVGAHPDDHPGAHPVSIQPHPEVRPSAQQYT